MAREKGENRIKAYDMWKENVLEGNAIKLKFIAEQLGEPDSKIRKWKYEDNWEGKIKIDNPNNVQYPAKARFGNKNSVGNKGGAPINNKNNMKHGFFTKILSEEALELVKDIEEKSMLEILWENIVIQYVAIARAQRIMYVDNINSLTKEPKKLCVVGDGGNRKEAEYEIQFAWDKQANFMQAQSRAMSTLQSFIAKYEELLNKETVDEEQKLKVQKLKLEIEKLKGDDDEVQDDGFIDALKEKVVEVWDDKE